LTTKSTRRIRFNGRDFLSAGLNVTDNPLIVAPNEMVEANNILVGSTLARRLRGGQAYFNTDASDEGASYPTNPKNGGSGDDPILGLHEFWRYDSGSGAPKSTLMVRQGTKIWGIDSRTGVATDLTSTIILPTTGRVTFQTFEGKVYWVSTDPAEGMYVWDGVAPAASTVPAGSQPPDGTPSYLLSHGGRMWGWGVPGFPYRGYYSEFFDATTWATTGFGATGLPNAAGSLDFDPFGDPNGIVGGVSFQSRLYLFMNRAQFEVTGNQINNFVVKTISRQIGCIGHHTIVPIANDVIYASERGILRMSSTDKAIESDYGFISRPISKLWNKGLNRSDFTQYTAAFDEEDNMYYISVPSKTATESDLILAFNTQESIWSGVWENHQAVSMANYVDGGINRVITGRKDGVLALINDEVRTDLGTAYTGRFKSGFIYPGGEMDMEHTWKHATVLASTDGQGTLGINGYVDSRQVTTRTIEVDSGEDQLGSSFILGTSKLGSGVFVPQTIPLKGQGYGLQIEVIYNAQADVGVYGFMIEAKEANVPVRGGSA